MLNNV